MCQIEYDNYCDVFEERRVGKARKPYRCDCCGGPIAAGEGYLSHFSVYEGEPCHEKCCTACEAARKEFFDAHDESVCGPSYFYELLTECIDADAEDGKRWQPMIDDMKKRGG